jgi:hypothetical protein
MRSSCGRGFDPPLSAVRDGQVAHPSQNRLARHAGSSTDVAKTSPSVFNQCCERSEVIAGVDFQPTLARTIGRPQPASRLAPIALRRPTPRRA